MCPRPGTSQARNAASHGSFRSISVMCSSIVSGSILAIVDSRFRFRPTAHHELRQLPAVHYFKRPGVQFQASFAREFCVAEHATIRNSTRDDQYWMGGRREDTRL